MSMLDNAKWERVQPIRIKKRNGAFETYDNSKIEHAILKAFNAVQPGNIPAIKPIVDAAENELEPAGGDTIDIERIQDAVEKALMTDHPDVAKAYILYRAKRAEARQAMETLHPDPNALGDYIHPAKYAKYLPEAKRRELYLETSHRDRDMHIRRWPQFETEIKNYWQFVDRQDVLPSMRSFQFGGAAIEQHNERMYNCSFSHADRIRFFGEAFYLLLCGCGVGFSVQWQHIEKMPEMGIIDDSKVRHFVVEDSIEGWGDAVIAMVDAQVCGYHIEYNYDRIRPKGSPLRTSGGVAPGHLPLKKALELIRAILAGAAGRQLRSDEIFDMVCHLADAVLAGGIRRSSLITLFSPDDGMMLYAKAPENFRYARGEDPGLRPHRAMSNISAAFLRSTVTEDQFNRVMKVNKRTHGEPGFVFLDNLDYGTNPCGEIGLNPVLVGNTGEPTGLTIKELDEWGTTGWAFCNLCEVNCERFKTADDMVAAAGAAAFIGTLQAAYTDFPYLGPITERIVRREALLGVSLMGIHDTPDISLNSWNQVKAAILVKEVNAEWAAKIGINKAARCTTVKPGGTAPKEVKPMCASGISYHHAKRYFMRITANPLEPVANFFKTVNPHMVEVKPNGDWSIVFPIEAPPNAITTKDATATSLVNDIFTTYENWIKTGTADPNSSVGLTHNVSSTVTFRPEEWEPLLKTIWENRHRIAAMAFLPLMSDKGIPFMPREEVVDEVDELKWQYLLQHYRPVDYSRMIETSDGTNVLGEMACMGGACDIDTVYAQKAALGSIIKYEDDFGPEGGTVMWKDDGTQGGGVWTPARLRDVPVNAVIMRHDTGWVKRYTVASKPEKSRTGRWFALLRPALV